MQRQLTLLQRRVIERLRDAGQLSLAETARDAWCRAEHCPLPVLIPDLELQADFRKADGQLLTGFTDRRG